MPFSSPFPSYPRRLAFRYSAMAISLLGMVSLVGCAASGQVSAENMTVDQFMQRLESQGLSVSSAGRVSRGGFAREGLRLRTGRGDNVLVFDYQNATSASMQINQTSSSSGTPPFFYQKGNIVAVHQGTDAQVEAALEAVLGPKKR